MDANEALGLLKLSLDETLRAIPFDPERRESTGGPSNGQMAVHGELILSLSCVDESFVPEIRRGNLHDFANLVNLTEAPEEALTDLLTNLMHYCHKEGVVFSEALVDAVGHFHIESGGAHV